MPRTPYWEDTVINVSSANGADTLTSLVGGLSEDERRGMTVVRAIVNLQLAPNPTSGVVGSMAVDIAIGLANQQAFTAGAGSLPDPSINSERPPRGWLYRTRTRVLDDATSVPPMTSLMEDIRAKRKVDAGILYLHLAPLPSTGTTFTTTITGIIRLLYLMA